MSVLDQAQNFSGGVISAARQRDRWARAEANSTDDERREQLREAIADLEARYPDIAEVPVGGAEAFARERGHGSGSRSPTHEGRRRAGAGGPARTGKTRPSPPAPRENSRKPVPGLDPTARRQRQGSSAATPRVDRAIAQTGIPAAAGSTGSVVMSALGVTAGLSLAYLLFSSAEQPGTPAHALPSAISGVTKFLGRFIAPVDFWSGHSQAQAETARNSGEPIYAEGPGSKIAKTGSRLKQAPRRHPVGDRPGGAPPPPRVRGNPHFEAERNAGIR